MSDDDDPAEGWSAIADVRRGQRHRLSGKRHSGPLLFPLAGKPASEAIRSLRRRYLKFNRVGSGSPLNGSRPEGAARCAWMCRCGSLVFPELPTRPTIVSVVTGSDCATRTLPRLKCEQHVNAVALQQHVPERHSERQHERYTV